MLTSTEAAALLHVHPSTVKRWCDGGALPTSLTAGGHRRIGLGAAVRFARGEGIRTVLTPFRPYEAHVWAALRALEDRGDHAPLRALALQWIRRGEFDRVEDLFVAIGRSDAIAFEHFCDGVVRGVMGEVGAEWQGGRLRVGDEHMTSQVMIEVLGTLRRDWMDGRDTTAIDRPVAIVGTLEGNHHWVGALCVRLQLERMGWRVYFPGPDVPIEDFAILQMSREASLVCVSLPPAAALGDVTRCVSLLGGYYDRGRPYDLVFGGPAPRDAEVAVTTSPFNSVRFVSSIAGLRDELEAGLGAGLGAG